MILDKGVCSVYRKVNIADAGAMPVYQDALLFEGWYGELNFETASARPTENREEVRCDARIRILQCREIANHDRVAITANGAETRVYEVTRAYHGRDDDNGEPITDLTLEVYEP